MRNEKLLFNCIHTIVLIVYNKMKNKITSKYNQSLFLIYIIIFIEWQQNFIKINNYDMIYIAYDYVCDVVMNILKNTLNINVQKFFYFI